MSLSIHSLLQNRFEIKNKIEDQIHPHPKIESDLNNALMYFWSESGNAKMNG